ncbi:MAG: hypothetical protein WA705_02065 [Candidatus Ozemobacteraceae bacterium]
MNKRLAVFAAASVTMLGAFWLTGPATAVTDGAMRHSLEANQFSEMAITSAIYPKTSHDIYHRENRAYVHGLPKTTIPLIYEPDVYTWQLAMAAHQKKRAVLLPPAGMVPETVQPFPMTPPGMAFAAPAQVQLTPLGPDSGAYRPLPPDSEAKMETILSRARSTGVTPDGQLRADSIKQRLLEHMNSLNAPAADNPSVPLLPQNLPRGQAGDSYDESYDSSSQPEPAGAE